MFRIRFIGGAEVHVGGVWWVVFSSSSGDLRGHSRCVTSRGGMPQADCGWLPRRSGIRSRWDLRVEQLSEDFRVTRPALGHTLYFPGGPNCHVCDVSLLRGSAAGADCCRTAPGPAAIGAEMTVLLCFVGLDRRLPFYSTLIPCRCSVCWSVLMSTCCCFVTLRL